MQSILESINFTSSLAALSASIATYIAFKKAMFQRKKQFREDYNFIQKLLSKFKSSESDMLPLELEAGFLAYTGKYLSANEIKLILSPTYTNLGILGLNNYINARPLLDVCANSFSYKEKYKNKNTRKFKYYLKLSGYFFWSALAYSPILYATDIYQIKGVNGIVISAAIIIGSGIMAYIYLNESSEFKSAEFLFNEKRIRAIKYPHTTETLKEV